MNRSLAQPSNRSDIDADEDPLVELARIVSEDGGGFAGSNSAKPRLTRNEPANRDSLADGLEAELLQELETSFAARETPDPVRAPVPMRSNPIPAVVSPAPQPSENEPDPDELLRSIEEQLSQFERRQAGRFSTVGSTFTPEVADTEVVASPAADEEPEALPFGAPSKAAEPRERHGSRVQPLAENFEAAEEAAEVIPEPVFEEPQAPPPRPEYRFRGPASAEWDRASATRSEGLVERSTITPRRRVETPPLNDRSEEPAFPAPESTPSPRVAVGFRAGTNGAQRGDAETSKPVHREHRATAFPEFDEPAAADTPAPDFAGIEAELSRELEPRYAATVSDDKWEDGDAPVDEPRVAAAITPGPSRRAAAARAAAAHGGRSRLGLFAAAVILVVLVGGAGAFYLRSSETAPSGPPPVIAAEPGAVRVDAAPEQAAANGETVGEAVYNRVAGNAPPTEEQVVESAEEPREIARIVLPQSQTPDESAVRPAGEEEASGAATDAAAPPAASTEPASTPPAAAPAEDELGPRRVPTFVVKADGSIVATSEAGATAPDPAAAQDQQLTSETEPIEPVPVPTVAIAEAGAPPTDAAGSAPIPTSPEESTPAESVANVETRPTIEEPPTEVAAAPAAPAPEPVEPAPEPAPAEVVAVAPAEPVAPPSATAGAGFLVQLSSEGSMADAQAAYARAQRRFPSVLGSLEPQIQEADLGAKGIFFRVRVGPWATRAEAIQVCESLKAAGGNCFVAK